MSIFRTYLVIVVAVFLVACGKPKIQYDAIPSGATVVAFGDSVTFGYQVSKEQNYPSLLATMSGWNIINAGVSGETSDQAKNRIATVLKEYHPQLVLIELGGNDFLKRRPEQAVKEDIRAVIQSVKVSNARPVLIAVPALSPVALLGKPTDASIYKELADEEKIPLIQSVFSDVLRDKNLRIDQVHPNGQGYQQMTEGIANQLRDHGIL